MARRRRRFKFVDIAQQVVGGFLLAGSFVVTEEVWTLAANMDTPNGVVIAAIVLAIGYGTLYGIDDEHDPDRERDVAGVPARFLSLIGVAFGSVVILALVFDAPETFLVETSAEEGSIDPAGVGQPRGATIRADRPVAGRYAMGGVR